MHIYGFIMVLCVYTYRNWLQNARFSLLYAIDAKYRFDITFLIPKYWTIKKLSTQRFYIVIVWGGGGGGGGGGSTAHQDYFIHFESSQSLDAAKRKIPKINHLATRKQNLACPTCDPS